MRMAPDGTARKILPLPEGAGLVYQSSAVLEGEKLLLVLCQQDENGAQAWYLAEADFDAALLGEAVSRYLSACKREARQVFLRRYWYGDSIQEIAKEFSFTQSKVKSMLHRTRQGLREFLREEGFSL